MELTSSAQEDAFRAEVRAFLDIAFTPELKARTDAQAGFYVDDDLYRDWLRVLHDKGWDVTSWPEEYGGTGWTPVQRYIFHSECAAAGVPFIAGMGLTLCAPVIMEFGTQEQKDYFLPRMRRGEDYWAQGFSEPQSGSDLASLQLRAVADGDDYVLNGTKIWTTHAQYSNWIFLLARTSSEGRKQEGITFIVCRLDLPGISIRPIESMSGEHEVNQVFFDDVRVPIANRIGDEGQGWDIAKYLLGFERGGRPFAAGLWSRVARLHEMAAAESNGDGGTLLQEESVRKKIAKLEISILAADWTERRLRYAQEAGRSLSVADASMMKIISSERSQELAEVTMTMLGRYAVADQRDALHPDPNQPIIGPDHALTPTARFLNGRAHTIFGGTSEVQRDILAKVALDF